MDENPNPNQGGAVISQCWLPALRCACCVCSDLLPIPFLLQFVEHVSDRIEVFAHVTLVQLVQHVLRTAMTSLHSGNRESAKQATISRENKHGVFSLVSELPPSPPLPAWLCSVRRVCCCVV